MAFLVLPAWPAPGQQVDWRTFAGSSGGPGHADGPAASARFRFPFGVDRDVFGNIHVSDTGNHIIRRISPEAVVSTTHGVPTQAGSLDGLPSAALFNGPRSIVRDTVGRFFLVDTENHTIRTFDGTGSWRVVAGEPGVPGTADGDGRAARFNRPVHLTLDPAGNAYVTDSGNHAIRKVVFGCCAPVRSGSVTTFAGRAGERGAQDGPADLARLDSPAGAAFDTSGNLFVADAGNHTLRLISPDGNVTTLAGMPGVSGHVDGTGSAARFGTLAGIAIPDGWGIFVSDSEYHTLRRVWPTGEVTTMAGSQGLEGWTDGSGAAARFKNPAGLTADRDGNVWLADSGNHAIRRFTGTGMVSTVSGAPQVAGSTDGAGSAARFSGPAGICTDARGTLFVADSRSHLVRRITPAGVVSTLAGMAGSEGDNDGPGAAARFRSPSALAAAPDGSVIVADTGNHTIRRIAPDGAVTTLAGLAGAAALRDGSGSDARFAAPSAVAVDTSGTVYVADTGNHCIRRILTSGAVTTIAGTGTAGSKDGSGRAAGFRAPAGLCLRGESLFIADTGNHTIRRQSLRSSAVVTIFGTAQMPGYMEGPGAAARFSSPQGMAMTGEGGILLADTGNGMVRLLHVDDGTSGFHTLAVGGLAGCAPIREGGTSAFCQPRGVASGAGGLLYVTDTGHERIARGIATGWMASLDNLPLWEQGRVARSSLATGATETIGQTFTAPFERMLRRITIALWQDADLAGCAEVEVLVMAWDGQKATGPVPHHTSRTLSAGQSSQPRRLIVETGGIELIPGARYVVIITAAGAVPECLTGTQLGVVDWTDSIGDGELVRFDKADSRSAWTSIAWQTEPAHDLALSLSFTAPLPAVQNGAPLSSPHLTHRQTTPVDFGTAVAPATLQRTFRVTHRGSFPLLNPRLSLPAGFSLGPTSSLPGAVNPGESFAITIRLAETAPATYGGNVRLSDANDEVLFEFPVTGRITQPQLSLTITDPACPGLNDTGGTWPAFRRPLSGSVARIRFTATNTGDAPLDVIAVLMWGPITPGQKSAYRLVSPAPTTGIQPGQQVWFELEYHFLSGAMRTASLQIRSNDPSRTPMNLSFTGMLLPPQLMAEPVDPRPRTDDPTGLRVQRITLTNAGCPEVPGGRVFIRGVPPGVVVHNASGQLPDGTWFLLIPPAPPQASAKQIVIEYRETTAEPVDFTPVISAAVDTEISASVPNTFAADRMLRRADGAIQIEFPTIEGRRYQVERSTGLTGWAAAGPPIRAAAVRTLWTDLNPSPGQGFYRVAEFAE